MYFISFSCFTVLLELSLPCWMREFPETRDLWLHFSATIPWLFRLCISFFPNMYIVYFLEICLSPTFSNLPASIPPETLSLFLIVIWPVAIPLSVILYSIYISPFLWCWQHQSTNWSFHKRLGFCFCLYCYYKRCGWAPISMSSALY